MKRYKCVYDLSDAFEQVEASIITHSEQFAIRGSGSFKGKAIFLATPDKNQEWVLGKDEENVRIVFLKTITAGGKKE